MDGEAGARGIGAKVLVVLGNARYSRQKLLPKVLSTYHPLLAYDEAAMSECKEMAT